MEMYKAIVAAHLSSMLEQVTEEDIQGLLAYPQHAAMGDLCLPCFKLSKLYRKAPQQIAEQLAEQLTGQVSNQLAPDIITRAEAVSGYVNLFFDKGMLAGETVRQVLREKADYGSSKIGQGKNIVLDFSSPNIAKPFHIAHLRSTVIGHSLYRIYKAQGYNCIRINHLGDWGTQFGKLVVAYKLWGDEARLAEQGIDELLKLYVKFHDQAEQQPELELEEQARQWFVRMEAGDEEALQLWQRFVEISLAEFKRIYELLGVEFDSYAGESFYNDKMEQAVAELKQKQLLEEDEGAALVRLEGYNMPPALILKKDGSSLYHTRDITAAIYRQETYSFEKAIYVTDYAQNLHFQQWFKIIELMGYQWHDRLVHVAFGRVSLEGMGLSTRKGNVLKLEEVLKQAIAKTKTIIEERNPALANKDEVARAVGVGAIIFNDLSANRIKDVVFTWEDALNFEGETGPYVQYTHARASSIIRKAEQSFGPFAAELDSIAYSELTDDASVQLVKELAWFAEKIELAASKLEPSIVSRYAIDLAQAFNQFYHHNPILHAEAPVREARLALVQAAKITLCNALYLIGLHAPEEM